MEGMLLLLGLPVLFALIAIAFWSLYGRFSPKSSSAVSDDPVANDSGASSSRSAGITAGSRRMRRRPVAAASSSTNGGDEEGELEEDGEEIGYYTAKSSKKREQKKQDKEARKQAESAARDHKREKQDRHAELRRRKDEEREAEEQRKEEELKMQKEKEEVAAVEEFDMWKGSFSVDTEGTSGENTQEGQSLINDFVDFIKNHKCVALEDLAAEFHLRTQECIDRIISLEQMGRLSGVMDDRGKFIYISPEEMKAVADYIKREGRVNISHLAKKSNEFIDLEPKQQEVVLGDLDDPFHYDTPQAVTVA
ncbi:hypothetical protein SELMODRAFT_442759 [Selaginella moellendorffii]|uniref:DDRGK domain-containing protein 1 n=1 Tax=Selaginella moellendorffii TaxID=88036 RepID=D8RVV1_SELML|nr:DDRGK domain-containing protein 1 [Selaginella moellendorffii]EFJ23839.1 hypothetical protein SELMODRAFT_442759 [Selaginella moellendorffii]|eukprot:XP_002975054.1 DDRGK domain-containing protein 1 [Selaginella moellendorffii]